MKQSILILLFAILCFPSAGQQKEPITKEPSEKDTTVLDPITKWPVIKQPIIKDTIITDPITKDTIQFGVPKNLTSVNGPSRNSYIPNILPPSPEAAMLGRFGEVPVSLSRGTIAVSIPIYEVQSGSLKLPVALNYQPGGVRVNDLATSVGLSWSLQAGGAMTRVVRGIPDEMSGGFFVEQAPEQSNTNAFNCYIGRVAERDGTRSDGLQDSYFYSFNDQSGRILYANRRETVDQPLASLAAVTVPYKPIKITGTTMVDTDGTIYQFGGSVNGQSSIEITSHSGEMSYSFASAWFLSKIISANRMDTIQIEYTSQTPVSQPMLWSTTLTRSVPESGVTPQVLPSRGGATRSINTIYPAHIHFKNGRVSFLYASDRQDLTGAKRLTAIVIYKRESSGALTEFKRFELEQSYFICTDGYSQIDYSLASSHGTTSPMLKRMKLNRVREKASTGATLPTHELSYYEDVAFPIYGSYAQDLWGFYNGALSNDKLLLLDTPAGSNAPPSPAYSANRSVSFIHTRAGSLKDIQYPTGGKTTFEYELHRHGSTNDGGGIRIKDIINTDASGHLTKKSYSYPGPYLINNISVNNMAGLRHNFISRQVETSPVGNCMLDVVEYTSYPESYSFMLGSNAGSSMAYSEVEETRKDGANALLGKTVSKFRQSTDWTPSVFPFETISGEWLRGHLIEQSDYNSSNQLVRQITNQYNLKLTDSLLREYGVRTTFRPLIQPITGCPAVTYSSWCTDGDLASTHYHQWSYFPFEHRTGALFLESTITKTYDLSGNNPIEELTTYSYGKSTHQQVTRRTIKDSRNTDKSAIYRYPHDMAGSNSVYQEMVGRNILTPIIEQEERTGSTTDKYLRTEYKKWYPTTSFGTVQGYFAPFRVEEKLGSGPWVTQLVYGEKISNPTESGYDVRARPKVFTDRNHMTTRLEWWSQIGIKDQLYSSTVSGHLTIYDYYPLIGLKYVTDPSTKQTWYNYDPFGRLLDIRENSAGGNLIKSFAYRYAGGSLSGNDVNTSISIGPPSEPSLLGVSCTPPSAPTITTSGYSVCTSPNQSVTLTCSTCASGTATWYRDGNQVHTGSSHNTNQTGTYTAKCVVNAGTCESPASSSITLTQASGCGGGNPPSGDCYTLSFRGENPKYISNHNGILKVKAADNSASQIWKVQYVDATYFKLVSQGSTNGTNTGYVLGVRNQGSSEENLIDLQTSASGDHQLWKRTELANQGESGWNKIERKNTAYRISSYRGWGQGNLSDGESDLAIYSDPDDIFGWNKWKFNTATCPGCTPPSAPSISKTAGTTVCAANSQKVTLTATNCSGTVTWYRNGTQVETGATYQTDIAGSYTATCTANGCTSSQSGTVVVEETSGCGGSQCSSPRDPENPSGVTAGLNYRYFESAIDNNWCATSSLNGQTPVKTGTVTNFSLSPRNRDTQFGFEFTGYLDVLTQGEYTFYLKSDDAGSFMIGNQVVVSYEGCHGVDPEQTGTPICLKVGRHAIKALIAQSGGDYGLQIRWSGPGISKQLIPDNRLLKTGCTPPSAPTIAITTGSTACASTPNNSVMLTATGCSGTVTWFRDGNQVATGSATHNTNIPGNYTATCTVNGCTSGFSGTLNVAQTSGCGSGNCYTLSFKGENPKFVSNHNGIVKVKEADNSNSQIWKMEESNGFFKLVSQGSTNGTKIGYVLGIRNQGGNENDIIDLQVSASGDHQLWSRTALTGTGDENRFKIERKGTAYRIGSVRNWGQGNLADGESDLALVADPGDVFGFYKWTFTQKTCPNP